jgi:DNA (cytosine-5)-methyltransferase 1
MLNRQKYPRTNAVQPPPETFLCRSKFHQIRASVLRSTPFSAIGPGVSKRVVGSKGGAGVAEQIISRMPPHDLYVEAFLGRGCVLTKKRPARASIAIDLDQACLAQFSDSAGVWCKCCDAVAWLFRAMLPKRTLVYCDPPYLMAARSCPRRYYEYEFTVEDHRQLLGVLRGLSCMVIVSGYQSDLYSELLADWRCESFWTSNRAGQRVRECVWMNYPVPAELHDGRFVGATFRQREKFVRRRRNLARKVLAMPSWERREVFEGIASVCEGGPRGCDSPRLAHAGEVTEPRRLVLSVFPGIDLLGRGFEQAGWCVVRGPDLFWGGDIRAFHPPRGAFCGVIGGPPCQDFSRARRGPPSGSGVEMLAEFARVVAECVPDWFIMENVPGVPDLCVPGYAVQRLNLSARECGLSQRRLRVFQIGTIDGVPAVPLRNPRSHVASQPCCVASEGAKCTRRGWSEFCSLQGLPSTFDLPGLSLAAKYRLVGNGVPVPMAAVIARSLLNRSASRGLRLCVCGCGRVVSGGAVHGGASCRKRMERRRGAVTRPLQASPGAARIL